VAQFEEAADVELCWRAVLQKADSSLGHLGNLLTALLREDSGRNALSKDKYQFTVT